MTKHIPKYSGMFHHTHVCTLTHNDQTKTYNNFQSLKNLPLLTYSKLLKRNHGITC